MLFSGAEGTEYAWAGYGDDDDADDGYVFYDDDDGESGNEHPRTKIPGPRGDVTGMLYNNIFYVFGGYESNE